MGSYFLESEIAFDADGRLIDAGYHDGAAKAFEPRDLRGLFGTFATGVTVISAQSVSGEVTGATANSFTSVSLDPPLVLVCFDRKSRTMAAMRSSGRFAIQILNKEQEQVAWHFAGRPMEEDAPVLAGRTERGVPCLEDALCVIDCDLSQVLPGGDHRIVLGEVKGFEVAQGAGEPLVFHRGRFGGFSGSETQT
ncbi:MAG: flavin reductase family protein [Pseudomonadota bacterium]